MAKEEAEEPEVVPAKDDSEQYVLVMSFVMDNLEFAEMVEKDINAHLDDNWVFRPEEKQTLGIIKASEYNSQAQHYVFPESVDIIREGDEYFYNGAWIKTNMSVGARLESSAISMYPVRRKVV